MRPIVLASASVTRAKVLRDAGVPFTAHPSAVDEAPLKRLALARGEDPRTIAGRLAEAKALAASSPAGALVIGGDQTLELDGALLDKTASLAETGERLRALRGRTFALHAAVVGAAGGEVAWRHTESARLTMRTFSDAFLDAYLIRNAAELSASLAGFALEGEGAQLFEAIDGDYFAILGLPFIPLLCWLRAAGGLET